MTSLRFLILVKAVLATGIRLAPSSIAVAMAIDLLSIPVQSTAQSKIPQSAEQSASLEEAKRLRKQVEQLYRERQYSAAIPLAIQALEIAEKVLGKEHADVAQNLNNLANLYRQQGSYQKAEPLYQRSLAIREKVLGKEHRDVAQSLDNLAELYRVQGNYAKAEPLFQRSLAIREKALSQEHRDVAQSLNNLAELYREQGSGQKAEPLFQLSLAIREKTLGKEHPDVAQSLHGLAVLYRQQGSYQKAEPLFQRSLAIWEKTLGKEHPRVAESVNNLAILYRQQGSYQKAEPLFQRSLAISEKALGKEHFQVASSLSNLALLYLEQGSYQKAEPLFLRSLAIREKALGKKHPVIALSLKNLAKLYQGQSDITRATDLLGRGLAVEESNFTLIYAVGSEQRKQNYATTFVESTNLAISLLLQQAPKNSEIARLALTTVLRRKGRVLDAVTDSVQTLRSQFANQPETQKLFEQWLSIRQQQAAFVYTEQEKQTPEAFQTNFKQLEEAKERLEETMSVKSAEFRNETQPVELEAIQAKIPKDAALVEIVQYRPFNAKANKKWGKPRYAAAVLRSFGEPSWVDLGDAADINESVSQLRKGFNKDRLNTVEEVQKLARKLDEQIMAPIRPLLGNARHLLLSPDGELTLIPFEVLTDEKKQYLIGRYAFSYLTSGRDLLRLELSTKSQSGTIVLGDVNYNQQEIVAAKPSSTNTRGLPNRRSTDLSSLKFNPLAATLEEAKEIKAIFPDTKLLLGKQATETAVKQLQSPSILHLATHGFFLEDQKVEQAPNEFAKQQQKVFQLENPLLRSGVALAGFNSRHQAPAASNDGVLTALEVAGLNLKATQLVVLSACATGLGEAKVGEGLYGLRRALVIAGSQSQILSLWKVGDAGTKELMVKYYQKLKAGQGRHEALRSAQIELLSHPDYEHPYNWASFVPSGNWTPLNNR